jgi:hypothetical protein
MSVLFAPFGISRPVRFAYQPPASSTFLSEQTSHQQPANNTFLSEQTSTSHQLPAERTECQLLGTYHSCQIRNIVEGIQNK